MRACIARWWFAFLTALGPVALAAAADLMEDLDYRVIPRQPIEATGAIEVIEFFNYGCHFCRDFEPVVERWLKTLPPDVRFRRVPAFRSAKWVSLARVYYALEAVAEADRLNAAVYRAFHDDGVNLSDPRIFLDWAQKRGADRERLAAAYDSEAVAAKVREARRMIDDYSVDSTPTMVVDGRYLTASAMVGSVNAQLPVVDALIERVRAERAAKQ